MPTYLVHGFRWDRINIRIHIVLHNLEDAAAECIAIPSTSVAVLNSFYSLFDFLPPSHPPKLPSTSTSTSLTTSSPPGSSTPSSPARPKSSSASSVRRVLRKKSSIRLNPEPPLPTSPRVTGPNLASGQNGTRPNTAKATPPAASPSQDLPARPKKSAPPERTPQFNDWSAVKLLEQYRVDDLSTSSQPYAYVGDYMVEVDLSASLTEQIAAYETKMRNEAAGIISPTPSTMSPKLGRSPTRSGNGSGAGPHPSSLPPPGTGQGNPMTKALHDSGNASATEDSTEESGGGGAPASTASRSHSGSVSGQSATSSLPRSMSIREARRANRRAGWLEKLRDQLQKNAEVGWFVVVCDEDDSRFQPPPADQEDYASGDTSTGLGVLNVDVDEAGNMVVGGAVAEGVERFERVERRQSTSESKTRDVIRNFFRRRHIADEGKSLGA